MFFFIWVFLELYTQKTTELDLIKCEVKIAFIIARKEIM